MPDKKIQRGLIVIIGLFLMACTTISPFSETAYRMSTGIKAAALDLMAKADEPYATHQKDVDALMLEAKKAYEYAKSRPQNEISAQQWAIMIDPSRHMLAGFFKRWQEKGTLGKIFIKEAISQISKGFDQISGLESGKIKKE